MTKQRQIPSVQSEKRRRVSDDGERSAEVEGATSVETLGSGCAEYNGKTTFSDVPLQTFSGQTRKLFSCNYKYRAAALTVPSDLFPVAIDISQCIMFNHG